MVVKLNNTEWNAKVTKYKLSPKEARKLSGKQ